MTGFEKRLNVCRACPVPASREDRLCEGRKPRTRATLSECPHHLFFLPEAQLVERFKALAVDHPPFSTEPAPPPESDAQIEALLHDPSLPMPRGWEKNPDVVRV